MRTKARTTFLIRHCRHHLWPLSGQLSTAASSNSSSDNSSFGTVDEYGQSVHSVVADVEEVAAVFSPDFKARVNVSFVPSELPCCF